MYTYDIFGMAYMITCLKDIYSQELRISLIYMVIV